MTRWLLLLAAVALGISHGAAAQVTTGTLTIADPEIVVDAIAPADVVAGRSATVALVVRNTGNQDLHVVASVGRPEWIGDRVEPADSVALAPGRAAAWNVTLDVRADAPNGSRVVRLHALVVETLRESKHVDLTLRIAEPPGGRAAPAAADPGPLGPSAWLVSAQHLDLTPVLPWQTARATIFVSNPTRETITIEPVSGPWSTPLLPAPIWIDVAPASVAIEPGQTVLLEVSFEAPPDMPVVDRVQIPIPVRAGSSTTFLSIETTWLPPPERPDLAYLALLAAPIALGALGWAALRRRDDLPWWFLSSFLPLFTRLAPAKVLDHATRERILAIVRAQPGIYWKELQVATRLPTGVLVHHLRTLERHGFVKPMRVGRRLRFYPAGERVAPPEPAPTPAQDRVLAALAQGALTQREVAERVGLTQQAVSYHLRNLERKGRIVSRAGPDGATRYSLVHVLRRVDPASN